MKKSLVAASLLVGSAHAIICYQDNRVVDTPKNDACITFEFGGEVFSASVPSSYKQIIQGNPAYRVIVFCTSNLCNYPASNLQDPTPACPLPSTAGPDYLQSPTPACPLPSDTRGPVIRSTTPACPLPSETKAPITKSTTPACPLPSETKAPITKSTTPACPLPSETKAPITKSTTPACPLPSDTRAPILSTPIPSPECPLLSETRAPVSTPVPSETAVPSVTTERDYRQAASQNLQPSATATTVKDDLIKSSPAQRAVNSSLLSIIFAVFVLLS
jgi:hypothetical protein